MKNDNDDHDDDDDDDDDDGDDDDDEEISFIHLTICHWKFHDCAGKC